MNCFHNTYIWHHLRWFDSKFPTVLGAGCLSVLAKSFSHRSSITREPSRSCTESWAHAFVGLFTSEMLGTLTHCALKSFSDHHSGKYWSTFHSSHPSGANNSETSTIFATCILIHGPLFHENATEIRYRFAFLSCSVCFFWSLNLVYPALRLSTWAFFMSLISCMRLANLRETKKEASP